MGRTQGEIACRKIAVNTTIDWKHSGWNKSAYTLNATHRIFRQNNNSSKQDQQTSGLKKQK